MTGDQPKENLQDLTLKSGSYDQVNYVAGSLADSCEHYGAKTRGKISLNFIKGLGRGTAGNVKKAFDDVRIGHYAIIHKAIGEDDVRTLPDSVESLSDNLRLGRVLGYIALHDQNQRKETKDPYQLGLKLADFCEVIDSKLAARILFAASNPDIAQEISKRNTVLRNIDVQPLAIDSIVLLPIEKRHEIFEEMARLEPGREGRASRLLSRIGNDWNKRNSRTSGIKIIHANLQGEKAGAKVLEAQGDLGELRTIIKAQGEG